MIFKDLRQYLDFLEENGKLRRVKVEVDTHFEIAAGIRKVSDTGGPALLFENIRGFPGWRVLGGLFATQKLLALALGLPSDADERSLLDRYLDCDQKRVKPRLVESGPVKEIIIKGEDVDLTKLPAPVYSKLDEGNYLTAGVEVGRHPETGVQNASIHRRKILGRNRTSLLAIGGQHLGLIIAAAEKKGQGIPVATVIGPEPAFTIGAICELPEGIDEAYVAGAFRRAPVELVKCETIDLEVPANAEIVIEGMTVPNERVPDGPFGEFPGNYITMSRDPAIGAPVVQVTAITMRKDPIFQAMLTGMPMTENHYLKKWATSAGMYRAIQNVARIKAINLTPGGTVQFHLVVAIDKKDEGQPREIIDTLLSTRHGPNHIVVVDDDIDVFDPVDVEWAIATRVRPDLDVVITQGAPLGVSTESTARIGVSRMGIDATAPLRDKKWYQKVVVPGVDKVSFV